MSSQVPLLSDDLLSLRKAKRRVTPLCCLPAADYQYGPRSPSVLVRSLPAVEQLSTENVNETIAILQEYSRSIAALHQTLDADVEMPAEELLQRSDLAMRRRLQLQELLQRARSPRAKWIQLAAREITVAHCSLSDITLQIEPSGVWQLSLRGDQNYRSEDRQRARNVDLQIKRNAFKVKVRLLRSSRSGGESLTPAVTQDATIDQAGKMVLAEIDLPEFWVQREAPQYLVRTGQNPLIASHFDEIDQAEFEFFVKLDPLTGSGEGVVAPWQREP